MMLSSLSVTHFDPVITKIRERKWNCFWAVVVIVVVVGVVVGVMVVEVVTVVHYHEWFLIGSWTLKSTFYFLVISWESTSLYRQLVLSLNSLISLMTMFSFWKVLLSPQRNSGTLTLPLESLVPSPTETLLPWWLSLDGRPALRNVSP